MIEKGSLNNRYTSTGKHSGYEIKLRHDGLNEIKHLFARDTDILNGKIHNQVVAWENKWQKKIEIKNKEKIRMETAAKSDLAEERTEKAIQALTQIEKILSHTLDIDDAVDWTSIKNTTSYTEIVTKHEYIKFNESNGCPLKTKKKQSPKKPERESFFIAVSFFMVILGKKKKIITKQKAAYNKAISEWEYEKQLIKEENDRREEEYKIALSDWKNREHEYLDEQSAFNKKIDKLKECYTNKDEEAIEEYCEIVLNSSMYPDTFPKDFELQYKSANNMLLIDYILPSIEDIPNLNIVKYVKSRDEFTEKNLSHTAHLKLFDSAIYQIALRTIHEIFEADVIEAIQSVNFNGIVNAVNTSTGHIESNCIISIQVLKEEFNEINLSMIDPKQCFKSLKGIGCAKLSSMTAVRPILELDKSDKRFTDHYEVASKVDSRSNLAAMDWEDFEHLVREIFEKEFAQNGGEVKVTQASSDGGVDAIAFDPDPIRGGKIVIQAKRYTNTVGVAAVRDLYGTVLNEGATKGILVTTAEFGPDSYSFAKDKPLTLLNGSNLLHLLEKHGHEAKIDLKEAKTILKDKAR